MPGALVVLDTEKDMGGTPIQTNFCFPPIFSYAGEPSLILERGVHKPSPAESLAPFYPDPTQRIIALDTHSRPQFLVLRVETLLKLVKDRGGTDIGWEEWKNHAVIPTRSPRSSPACRGIYVSGCRLFFNYFTSSGPYCRMEAFDSSMQGRTKRLSERTIGGYGAVTLLSSTGLRARFPMKELSM